MTPPVTPTVDEHSVLVRSNRLARRRSASGREGVFNEAIGRLVHLNDEGWKLLDLFREPITPRAVADAGGIAVDTLPRMLDVVAALVRSGLLVAPNEDEYLYRHGRDLRDEGLTPLVTPATGLFQAAALPAHADVVFFGVPLDMPSWSPGAAGGPASLRRMCDYLPAVRAGQDAFPGIWDAATETCRLVGARFADLGDVVVRPDDSLEAKYAGITRVLEHALRDVRGVPIALGGDHSITWPVIRALPHETIFLVQFDAHADLNEYLAGDAHNHANVMNRLLRESQVDRVLQVGVRDVSAPWCRPADRVEQVGAYRAARMSPGDILALVPEDAACYISIDIDVLDPSTAPATCHPMPGGLALEALEAVLESIGTQRRVVGADLVEISASAPGAAVTSVCGLRLLMRLCEGILARRRCETA